MGREPSIKVASERDIGRLGDFLSCLVVVASESIERDIEPVSGIDLPHSEMMSRKMAEKSIVEHLEVHLRPFHPKEKELLESLNLN